jgi:hypothetical protein
MSKAIPKLYTRKYMGDDRLSWAVFAEGNPTPIDSGLSRTEAAHTKKALEAMYRERAAGGVETFRGGA